MKKTVGFIALAFLYLMVACSSMSLTETMQPTAITDFKSVAGKWEGLLVRDHPFTQNYDRATLIIGDTGARESTIVRTRTTASGTSVSSQVIRVLDEKGKLVPDPHKAAVSLARPSRISRSVCRRSSGERMLKADTRDYEGFTYSAELKRTGDSASAK
jgi:hypothetical protein